MRVLISLVLAIGFTPPVMVYGDDDFVVVDLEKSASLKNADGTLVIDPPEGSHFHLDLETRTFGIVHTYHEDRVPVRFRHDRVGTIGYIPSQGVLVLRTPIPSVLEQVENEGGRPPQTEDIRIATVVESDDTSIRPGFVKFEGSRWITQIYDSRGVIFDLSGIEKTPSWNALISAAMEVPLAPLDVTLVPAHRRLLEPVFAEVREILRPMLPPLPHLQLSEVSGSIETQFWNAAAEVPLGMTEQQTRAFLLERRGIIDMASLASESLESGEKRVTSDEERARYIEHGLNAMMQMLIASRVAGLSEQKLVNAVTTHALRNGFAAAFVGTVVMLFAFTKGQDFGGTPALTLLSLIPAMISEAIRRSSLRPTHGPYETDLEPIQEFLRLAEADIRKLLGCETVLEGAPTPGPNDPNWALLVTGF